eukprot:TRINITY_DN20604_c0_g1_i1.p1 TRINITY_DN20604_c0_g1~~TRINITY_DN20604_c0_g1_i1.p1  ORF type:complete len:417 (+),score=66.73 TRINITY_DN20604_c0_g1_i1:499-1749(+)
MTENGAAGEGGGHGGDHEASRHVFLQAFNWESHKSESWWKEIAKKVEDIAAAGITAVWLPPASDSLAPQGYMPRDLYSLNSAYGEGADLRALLDNLRAKGVETCADVVINHRIGSTQGDEGRYNRYDGMAMPWDECAVTSDSGGKGNAGSGIAKFDGAPNIDHSHEGVRKDLAGWLKWLRNDVGFTSFRFDFAKGYSAGYVKEYIEAAEPVFAVGEYWDACNYSGEEYTFDFDQNSHRQRIVKWIKEAGGLASAFDFTTKGILQEAVKSEEWWRLRDAEGKAPGLIGVWPGRAVTFVENHDTGSTQAHWPFPSEHILQGYAYILTHPGVPTVFFDHLYEWGDDVRNAVLQLIAARKKVDIHSCSEMEVWQADKEVYAARIGERLCMKLGTGDWCPDEAGGWSLETSGESYAVWTKA